MHDLDSEHVSQPRFSASVQRKQLEREIACLERQLERLNRFDKSVTPSTFGTYQEMIESRKQMLASLNLTDKFEKSYSLSGR